MTLIKNNRLMPVIFAAIITMPATGFVRNFISMLNTRPQCDQVQKTHRDLCRSWQTIFLQLTAKRCCEIERDTDTREIQAWKGAAVEIRVQFDIGDGVFGARQMMVGDDIGNSELLRFWNARIRRHAVVYGDQQVR